MTEAEALTASLAAKQQGIDDLTAALATEREKSDELFSEFKRIEVLLAETQARLSALKVENACLRWVVEQALK